MSFDFEMGIATFAGYDEDGFPVVQFDGQGDKPQVGSIELHHPFGFASLPREPDLDPDGQPLEGKACNLLFATEGNTMHAWVGYDPRFWKGLPTLKKGGSMRYCAPGSFEVFDGENGTNTLYVPVPDDKAHVFTVGLDGNKDPYVGLVHALGMGITMLHKSLVIKNAAGDAYIELNDSGTTFNGNTTLVGGLAVGNVALAVPVVKADGLVAYINSLETALAAIASGAASAPGGGAVAAAQTAHVGALAALLAKLPTTMFSTM